MIVYRTTLISGTSDPFFFFWAPFDAVFSDLYTAQSTPKNIGYALGLIKSAALCSIITWDSSTTNLGAVPTSHFPLP